MIKQVLVSRQFPWASSGLKERDRTVSSTRPLLASGRSVAGSLLTLPTCEQTVWLEPVPEVFIQRLVLRPDLARYSSRPGQGGDCVQEVPGGLCAPGRPGSGHSVSVAGGH